MEIKAANAEETIRCILDEEKMTQQDLADRMGIKMCIRDRNMLIRNTFSA